MPAPKNSAPGATLAAPGPAADQAHPLAGSAPLLLLGSMSAVQLGLALSRDMFATLGVVGTTGLRLLFAALILMAAIRPRVGGRARRDLASAALLGFASGAMTLLFAAAVNRLPLALVTTIDFLGPLAVALVRSRRTSDVLWALAAIGGVVLITQAAGGGHGRVDPLGVAYAAGAALCWATYIVLTTKVGKAFEGFEGLAISMLMAAVAVAPFGVGEAWHGLARSGDPALVLLQAAGLAVLLPIVPYLLEMTALRRLPEHVFSILMSLEPAIAALIGLLVLSQTLGPLQLAGIACVITASIAATTASRRRSRAARPEPAA